MFLRIPSRTREDVFSKLAVRQVLKTLQLSKINPRSDKAWLLKKVICSHPGTLALSPEVKRG